jgi:single-strand DNA-binding protein
MTYHQTTIVGNIGSLDLQYLQSGTVVCRMSVAVNEYWNDRETNERRERVTWYKVSMWGKQGGTAHRYLAKGRQVMVVGTVEASAYMGQDGQPQASLELRAQEVKFLQGGNGANEPASDRQPDGENIPF